MKDIIINFLVSLGASYVFYYFIESLKQRNIPESNNTVYSKNYIKGIKKQFYICYSLICFLIFQYLRATLNEPFATFRAVLFFFLLLLMLFAFMCAIEVIEKLSDKKTTDRSE